MDFSVLGPLAVRVDGVPVELRRGLPRALLTFLLLRRRTAVGVDVIADRLWAGQPPADPANAVHRVVSYLRRTLGPRGSDVLVTRAPGYALLVDDEAVDAHRFERLVGAGRDQVETATTQSARRGLDLLDAALGLWRDDPLVDVASHEWAAAPIAALGEARVLALQSRVRALVVLGRHDDAVAAARAVVAEHPLREDAHAELMLALYRSGRQSEALEAYRATQRLLAAELGLDPGPRLRDLERRILAQDDTLDAAAARPEAARPEAARPEAARPEAARRAAGAQHGPMVPPTSLIGRDDDLVQLAELLGTTRLLTLTGPGGAGKTRTALELARRHVGVPVWFVDLSVLPSAELVASSTAHAVGAVRAVDDDPVDAVVRHLADQPGLLVLDNCEHVVDAVAQLSARLQHGCPRLVQLATSRRPLRIAGEVTWSVPPLPLPPSDAVTADAVADTDAVRLFAERAAAVRPGFAVTDANAADVAAIVHALDGLPLAIELAAGHTDVLAPDALRRRLSDRFDLLETDVRDMPARQRTMRAVVESSVDLLTAAERRFFTVLGVFAGGFDLDDAAAVTATAAGECYRLIASLVRQSLVATAGDGRFRLLESLRLYAADALAGLPDAAEVHRRHLEHMLTTMSDADQGLRAHDQDDWLARATAAMPDIRAALRWAFEGGAPQRGALLVAAASWYWTLEGMLTEARQWLDLAATVPTLDDDMRARLLLAEARIAAPLGDLARSAALTAQAVAIRRRSDERAGLAGVLITHGIAQWGLGNLPAAAAAHDEAIDLLTAGGAAWELGTAQALRARTAVDADEPDAEQRIDAAVATCQRSGDKHAHALALSQRARLSLVRARAAAAHAAATECLDLWTRIGYREGIINAHNLLARTCVALGRTPDAETHARTALSTAVRIGHRGGLCEALECLAAVLHATDRETLARRLLLVATAERRRHRLPQPTTEARHLPVQPGPPAEDAPSATVEDVLAELCIQPDPLGRIEAPQGRAGRGA